MGELNDYGLPFVDIAGQTCCVIVCSYHTCIHRLKAQKQFNQNDLS